MRRVASVHGAIVLAGVLAFSLFAQTAGAQTPEATSTGTATGTSTGTSAATGTATGTPTPVTFEVTDEGKAQLLRMLRARFLPGPARSTLAALLEQNGVQHDVLARLFERPRHCDDGHGRDDEHSRRCRDTERKLDVRAIAGPRCATATPSATATGTATATATATATGTATGTATATATATGTATGTATATATSTGTAAALLREHCDRDDRKDQKKDEKKEDRKPTGTATAALSPAEICALALRAAERSEKLLDRCVGALKADRAAAAAICAEVTQAPSATKGAVELARYCQKLLAEGTAKAKPTDATGQTPKQLKPVEQHEKPKGRS